MLTTQVPWLRHGPPNVKEQESEILKGSHTINVSHTDLEGTEPVVSAELSICSIGVINGSLLKLQFNNAVLHLPGITSTTALVEG